MNWLKQVPQELRTAWLLYLPLSACLILFCWTQDLVPIAGPIVASILIVLSLVRLFQRTLLIKKSSIFLLGLFNAPVTSLWLLLFALHRNSDLSSALSTIWSLPLLFFMILWMWVLTWTICRLAENSTLDAAFKNSWSQMTKQWRPVYGLSILFAGAYFISYFLGGVLLIVVVPVHLALVKISATAAK